MCRCHRDSRRDMIHFLLGIHTRIGREQGRYFQSMSEGELNTVKEHTTHPFSLILLQHGIELILYYSLVPSLYSILSFSAFPGR